jgi:hypothetical protein
LIDRLVTKMQLKESFKILFVDKIRCPLPEACLDHVLTFEGDKWLECDALANVVDIYFANYTIIGLTEISAF